MTSQNRENSFGTNKTVVYTYDDLGNLLRAYDEIGNPLSYRDGIQFTWDGRQLVSMQREADTVWYTCGSNGIRTAKTVHGVETRHCVKKELEVELLYLLKGGSSFWGLAATVWPIAYLITKKKEMKHILFIYFIVLIISLSYIIDILCNYKADKVSYHLTASIIALIIDAFMIIIYFRVKKKK